MLRALVVLTSLTIVVVALMWLLGPPVLFRFGDQDRYVVFNPLRDRALEQRVKTLVEDLVRQCNADAIARPHCEQLRGRLGESQAKELTLFDIRDHTVGQVTLLQFSINSNSAAYPMLGLFVGVRWQGSDWAIEELILNL